MASIIDSKKRVVLGYEQGSLSFSKFDFSATDEQVYQLATILNSFQAERPPEKIKCITTAQVI